MKTEPLCALLQVARHCKAPHVQISADRPVGPKQFPFLWQRRKGTQVLAADPCGHWSRQGLRGGCCPPAGRCPGAGCCPPSQVLSPSWVLSPSRLLSPNRVLSPSQVLSPNRVLSPQPVAVPQSGAVSQLGVVPQAGRCPPSRVLSPSQALSPQPVAVPQSGAVPQPGRCPQARGTHQFGGDALLGRRAHLRNARLHLRFDVALCSSGKTDPGDALGEKSVPARLSAWPLLQHPRARAGLGTRCTDRAAARGEWTAELHFPERELGGEVRARQALARSRSRARGRRARGWWPGTPCQGHGSRGGPWQARERCRLVRAASPDPPGPSSLLLP